MTTAAAAAEYKSNVGFDYSLAAELADFEAEQEAEDETAARRALNARMAEWYGIG